MKIWPYHILRREDQDIKADLECIMQHFGRHDSVFDIVVFIPNAGLYLGELFESAFGSRYDIKYVTVQRASTIAKIGRAKRMVFSKKWLADAMRHVEVLARILKYKFGMKQKMVARLDIDFEVAGRRILVIDDSVDTGTTLQIVKATLLQKGAASVATACISNHLLPRKVGVDYAVYEYALLRTKNSRDFDAA